MGVLFGLVVYQFDYIFVFIRGRRLSYFGFSWSLHVIGDLGFSVCELGGGRVYVKEDGVLIVDM